jgi:hypothetical protein
MTPADWLIGTVAAGALWAVALLVVRQVDRQRRNRERRELRRSAARAAGGRY